MTVSNEFFCLHCEKQLLFSRNNANKYCNNKCQQNHQWVLRKQKLLSDGYDPLLSCKRAKKYLIEQTNHSCQICNLCEWMGQPIPLTLDHINGNSEDNTLSNLRVICANCDRLTLTFGSKNRGNGRANRRQRYQDGKSY